METISSLPVPLESYESSLSKIRDFLYSADASSFSICANIYEIIINAENQARPKLFEMVATLYEDIESDETVRIAESPFESQEDALEEQYGKLVNSFIAFYISQHYNTELFYEKMWETIQSNLFFPNDAAKVFAFYYIMIDKRIPYFELIDGYQMSNEAYQSLRRKHSEELRKIRYINNIQFNQKTEHASLILNEIGIRMPESDASVELISSYEEKLIILVEALNAARATAKSLDRLFSQIKSDIGH